VAVDINRSKIGGLITPIRLGNTGYVEIIDQNGIVVTRTKPGPALAPFEQSDHSGRFAALMPQVNPPVVPVIPVTYPIRWKREMF